MWSKGETLTPERATLLQQLSNLSHAIEQFCVNFGDAVKTGAFRSLNKNSTALVNLVQHPLEALHEVAQRVDARDKQLIELLHNHFSKLNESNITTTSEQAISAVCEHVRQQNFFERVEETTEAVVDVLTVAAVCKGAARTFEMGSKALERTVAEGLSLEEVIPTMVQEMGASLEQSTKEFLDLTARNGVASGVTRVEQATVTVSEGISASIRVANDKNLVYSNINQGLNFARGPAIHMEEAGRYVPVEFLRETIRNTKGYPDPRGTNAVMHYNQIYRDGKLYNLEVLYDEATNTVKHFMYSPGPIGPLSSTK